MSNYTFPDLTGRHILYRGRRFIAFSISKSAPFEGMENFASFVVWDGLYNASIACGTISKNGLFDGVLTGPHVDISVKTSDSIKEFIKNANKGMDWYFKQ